MESGWRSSGGIKKQKWGEGTVESKGVAWEKPYILAACEDGAATDVDGSKKEGESFDDLSEEGG